MMRKALFFLTMLSLAAPGAYGQTLTALDGHESDGLEVAVFLRPITGQTPEAFAMHRLLIDALETSRALNRVDVPGDATMQLEAPMALTREPNSRDVQVSYDVWTIRGLPQGFSTTCPAGQPERCVENIVLRTERMARMDPTRR
jgi:hypothetical protein